MRKSDNGMVVMRRIAQASKQWCYWFLQAEFDAEQEYLKTLSYLSPEDQKKYTERQGVSFMYQKPPGYDAAMSKAAEQVSIID